MDFLAMRFLSRMGHLLVWHASIVSGAYKQRRVFHGTQGPEFTEGEKLADAMATIKRHAELLDEIAEYRGEHGDLPAARDEEE
jgi:hypothetical protein